MNEDSAVFEGEIADFGDYDWEALLAEAKDSTCEHYYTPLSAKANELKEAGDEKGWRVFRFISVLSSFSDQYHDRTNPYRSLWWNSDGTRSLIPEDLTNSDLDVIEHLLKKVNDPALKGRMADVLWVRRKNHTAARIAAGAFVDAARKLLKSDAWDWAIPLFQRAVQLGKILGRASNEFNTAEVAVMDEIRIRRGKDPSVLTCAMIEMLLFEGAGNPSEMGEIAKELAEMAARSPDEKRLGDWELRAERYWSAAEDAFNAAGDLVQTKGARLGLAEAIYQRGKLRVEEGSTGFMSAGSILAQAVEALRRAGGPVEKIKKWKSEMYDFQERSVSEMTSFPIEIDIKEGVRSAESFVRTDNLHEALFKGALSSLQKRFLS